MIDKKWNKSLEIGIGIGLFLLIAGAITSLMTENTAGEQWINIGLMIGEFAGLLLLLLNGTLIRTQYFRIIRVLIAFLLIGILMKIVHVPYANTTIVAAYTAIFFVYLLSFLKKPVKKRIDFIKLCWAAIFIVAVIMNFLHLSEYNLHIMAGALMWLAVVDYFKTIKKVRKS